MLYQPLVNNQTGGKKLPLFIQIKYLTKMIKSYKPSYENFMLQNGKKGQVFYSSQTDKTLTSLSSKLNRKITTENIIGIKTSQKRKSTSDNPEAFYIVKVTLL
jgi:hypothetical protein